jgi:NitT/TauT family transport system substrate-binding protein
MIRIVARMERSAMRGDFAARQDSRISLRSSGLRVLVAAAASLLTPAAASAADLLKLTVGQRGNWDTSISYLGEKAGIFKKHGLELEIVYTSGSGETLQPVIAGSVDLGLAVGTLGAISAYAKHAPVRIVGAEATGAADYWYAKASSPIKTLQDTNGRTIAFSTQGSSTQSIVRAFIDEFKLTAKPIATGNPSATLTAVMTDQVDVGWASPPFGLKEIEAGQIHVVAKATDSTLVRGQTIRVIVANAQTLDKRKDIIARYLDAYRETIEYMYSDNPQVFKDYAAFVQVPEAMARRVRDEFFPKALVDPDEIKGIDSLLKEAVNLKFISAPLTSQQLAELIQIPPRKK